MGHFYLQQEAPGGSGAYSRASSVKVIQAQLLQEQLQSREVACEYIKHISLISKCQRGGGFTINIIACCSFLIIKNGIFFQFSGTFQFAGFRTNPYGPDYKTHESVPTFAVGSMAKA